jgi:hypothetical protein
MRIFWTTVDFGMYKSAILSIPEVILRDPDWFFWACENNAFPGHCARQVADLAQKEVNIKIPEQYRRHGAVEYFYESGGIFDDFDVVHSSDQPSTGRKSTRSDRLDLSLPHACSQFAKEGSRGMMCTFRNLWFGDPGHVITKEEAEAFFEDPANFFPEQKRR